MQTPARGAAGRVVPARLAAAAASLPPGPGVYRFRDASGRALYLGRAVNLRRRVRSYWGDLGDRPHLTGMVPRIARIEAVACDSEHEAAWLERNLLERRILPWNRTPGGQEVEVYLRLDRSSRTPGLTAVHVPVPGTARRHFGPYLGGGRVRLAAAGLLRAYPLDYTGVDPAGAVRGLASQRGVTPADRDGLAASISAVLQREPAAVAALGQHLARRRDEAAGAEAYEVAGRIQAELAAVDWVTCPQRATGPESPDTDVCGWTAGVLVRFEIRTGRIRGWRQDPRTRSAAAPWLARTPPEWRDFADRNALLASRLAGDGHG